MNDSEDLHRRVEKYLSSYVTAAARILRELLAENKTLRTRAEAAEDRVKELEQQVTR